MGGVKTLSNNYYYCSYTLGSHEHLRRRTGVCKKNPPPFFLYIFICYYILSCVRLFCKEDEVAVRVSLQAATGRWQSHRRTR